MRTSLVDGLVRTDSPAPAGHLATGAGEVSGPIAAWLLGEAPDPIEGIWIGDEPDAHAPNRRAWWWRSKLRCLLASPRPAARSEGEPGLRTTSQDDIDYLGEAVNHAVRNSRVASDMREALRRLQTLLAENVTLRSERDEARYDADQATNDADRLLSQLTVMGPALIEARRERDLANQWGERNNEWAIRHNLRAETAEAALTEAQARIATLEGALQQVSARLSVDAQGGLSPMMMEAAQIIDAALLPTDAPASLSGGMPPRPLLDRRTEDTSNGMWESGDFALPPEKPQAAPVETNGAAPALYNFAHDPADQSQEDAIRVAETKEG